jgi:hypothetical protein
MDLYADYVLLSKVADHLCVNHAQLRGWALSNGFKVENITRKGYLAPAVPKETARAIIEEAKKQGLENPYIKEKGPDTVPDRIDEPTTLAYRMRHPGRQIESTVKRIKAKPSWELGYGDREALPP